MIATPAQKIELARRINEEGLRFYAEHPAALRFHKSQAEIRVLSGPNQSGKSWSGSMEMAMTAGKVHPYRPNYIGAVWARDCCVDFTVLSSVLVPTYKRILPRKKCILPGVTFEGKERFWPGLRGGSFESAYDKIGHTIYLDDGSFIEFKTYAQGKQDRDSFAGPPRHIIRHDEEPPQALFNENQARQLTTGVNILFSMTPLRYSQWLYADIYLKSKIPGSKIEEFTLSLFDNPYISPEVIESMDRNITDPAERAARLFGEWTYPTGLVYQDYGDKNYIDYFNPPEDWHRSVVIDPHPATPTAVNWFAEDKAGRLFSYREADLRGDIEQVCTEINARSEGEHIDMYMIDPAVKGQKSSWGRDTVFVDFRKHFPGILLASNNVERGIDLVRKRIKSPSDSEGPSLFIMKSCPVTDAQMRGYSWKPPLMSGEDRTKAQVVKRDDHHPDNLRYRCGYTNGGLRSMFNGFNVGLYGNG